MSYILEALRKADQEREAGVVPDLESVHEAARPAQRSFRWVWILVALLAVNGVLMALLATRDTGTTVPRQVASPTAVPAQEAAASAPSAAGVAVPADSSPVRMAALPKTAPKVESRDDRPAPAAPVIPSKTATLTAGKSAASVPVVPAPPDKAQPQVTASVAPVPAQRAEIPRQGLRDWEDLSLEFRSGLDMPRLDVHVYDADPQRRFVLINLRKYRSGDRLESGAVIEEILPDGIKLSYQGTRFRYRK